MGRTIVAVYDTLPNRDQLQRELEALGLVEEQQFRISSNPAGVSPAGVSEATKTTREPHDWLEWLVGIPEEEVTYYREGLERDRVLVSVRASDADTAQVTEILERYDPIDIGAEHAGMTASAGSAEKEGQIPDGKEELKVDKRPAERGRVRVRSYTVE